MSSSVTAEPPVRFQADLPPRLRRWVTVILRGGTIVSVALLIVGLVVWGAQGAPTLGGTSPGTSPPTLAAEVAAGTAIGFLALGLLVLVLTPLARVLVSLTLFAKARDRHFVLFTAFVLAVLTGSVFLALFGLRF